MAPEEDEKQKVIEEIQRRINFLISTDEISPNEKVLIAREFFQTLLDQKNNFIIE